MSEKVNKMKLLKKYMSKIEKKTQQINTDNKNITLIDNDDMIINQISSDSQESEIEFKHKRIQSSQQQNQHYIEKEVTKNKKIKKQLRKVLGLKKGYEIDQFLKEIKLEGMNLEDLKKQLKDNKAKIILENPKDNKIRKKHKNKDKDNKSKNKFVKFEQEQSSDIDIPETSRVVYRNKDGTIMKKSMKQLKQDKVKEVELRLGEWEKGMQREDSDENDDQQLAHAKKIIWQDPIRRWQDPTSTPLTKPLTCKFSGAANRFNIKPGYRWDGVIRGNGYETKYLQELNHNKIRQNKNHQNYMKNL